jgi:hypothetical protein
MVCILASNKKKWPKESHVSFSSPNLRKALIRIDLALIELIYFK